MAPVEKILPATQETQDTWLCSLGREIPGGGPGNPLQCSCLENPTDRGAWRVAKNWTQLKRLSMHTRYHPLTLVSG